ncbi:hypothetical protein A2960_05750 [Candidatus Gottesmanbacteria bacterium RIFCSPLOWO2_01_FULL_39_12b]|uniref:Uncharacterized protein n=1 Tax=Candidatus Gottesmanbacteria bacterium RIFCSPLOWO2_01_FULL_39_12b TaxID=1798388 RepID=A0A1F6AMV2_9BACT|nr:MAG: hypothetical protein A2960_05750 [Candidatus Gottesmanbacteria bacterium RIFCSPLOWO2_01_FULL_39_12b]
MQKPIQFPIYNGISRIFLLPDLVGIFEVNSAGGNSGMITFLFDCLLVYQLFSVCQYYELPDPPALLV